MKLFDAHTHTQFSAFDKDRDAVIKRALDQGIGMINVGSQKDTSVKAVELAQKYDGVYATVGLHPIHLEKSYHDPGELGYEKGFTSRAEEFEHDFYKKLALNPKVVAIGECGFDYYRTNGEEIKVMQKQALVCQIDLAIEVSKPLMIHCRSSKTDNAYADLIKAIGPYIGRIKPSVMHFFAGSHEDADILVDMGFSFTFGGVITFVHDYDKVVKKIPIERIIIETDAPYVAPAPFRGQRNEPLYVKEVAKKMAELKNMTYEEICEVTLGNTKRIFSI